MRVETDHNGHNEAGLESSGSSVTRVVLASFIGTTIEWYDFFLYGTASVLIFNQLFFPTLDPLAGTMAAFTTYAVGFFARPLGGVVFGHFGDRRGRKSMLVATLMLMGIAKLREALPNVGRLDVRSGGVLGVSRFGLANCELREIMPDSPAAKVGLQPSDVIGEIDGKALETTKPSSGTLGSLD